MVVRVKVAQEAAIPPPATSRATPLSPAVSTTIPASGGPAMAATPRLKVNTPKAVLRAETPSIWMRAGGVADTQTPVTRPNTALVTNNIQNWDRLK